MKQPMPKVDDRVEGFLKRERSIHTEDFPFKGVIFRRKDHSSNFTEFFVLLDEPMVRPYLITRTELYPFFSDGELKLIGGEISILKENMR